MKLPSATRVVLILLVLALVVALFVPVNAAVLPIFEKALTFVLGAFFGMKVVETPVRTALPGSSHEEPRTRLAAGVQCGSL